MVHVSKSTPRCAERRDLWGFDDFTTIVVGRFVQFAAAIWLYAGNTMLISAVSFRLLALTPSFERRDHLRDRYISLSVLIVSSLLAIGWSFVSPSQALWLLALNYISPLISRWAGVVRHG
jgi:hypothetical protein